MSSVAGIIFRGDEVLLIKRRDVPVWVLPGGAIDPNETPDDAVVRELMEETGYTVSIVRKIAEYLPANRLTRYTHFYECKIDYGEMELTDETSDIGFFSTLPKQMPPPYPQWIADARLGGPLIRRYLTDISYPLLLKTLLKHPVLTSKFLISRISKN